jgi:hypothetical protein
MVVRRLWVGPVVLLALGVLSGCHPRTAAEAVRFDDQGGNDAVACLVHQASPPDAAYKGGPQSDTMLLLPMLHYYVANGNKPYCDGKGPNPVDRAWLQDYLHLGAVATHISRYATPEGQPSPPGGTH